MRIKGKLIYHMDNVHKRMDDEVTIELPPVKIENIKEGDEVLVRMKVIKGGNVSGIKLDTESFFDSYEDFIVAIFSRPDRRKD